MTEPVHKTDEAKDKKKPDDDHGKKPGGGGGMTAGQAWGYGILAILIISSKIIQQLGNQLYVLLGAITQIIAQNKNTLLLAAGVFIIYKVIKSKLKNKEH